MILEIKVPDEHSRPWFGESSFEKCSEILSKTSLKACQKVISVEKYLKLCHNFSIRDNICPIFEAIVGECLMEPNERLQNILSDWRNGILFFVLVTFNNFLRNKLRNFVQYQSELVLLCRQQCPVLPDFTQYW